MDSSLLPLFYEMDTKLRDKLNDYLLREFGRGLEGLQNYRIIWSTGVTEKRLGTFTDFYGKIFVREVTEVREVLKYPYDQDRWILERVQAASMNPELVAHYSYEPIYVFKDKRGFYLPLNEKVVTIIADNIKHPQTPGEIRARYEKEIAEEERKEIEEFVGILDEVGRSPLFAYEDSVFLDSTKRQVN